MLPWVHSAQKAEAHGRQCSIKFSAHVAVGTFYTFSHKLSTWQDVIPNSVNSFTCEPLLPVTVKTNHYCMLIATHFSGIGQKFVYLN